MADKLDKQQLQQTFEEIRDEHIPKANTARRIGNAFLSLFEFAAPNDEKLSSVYDDTAQGLITFAKGLVSKALAKLASLFVVGDTQLGENDTKTTFGDFKADATGASISVDKDGTSTAEFDFLNIRRAAYFREITIKELKHVGGELALSAAAMTCSKVEWLNVRGRVITAGTPTYYKCYFETTDGKRHIYQEFAVGDQARCQQFRIEAGNAAFTSTKYYWRLVTGVGDNYIILSNQDGKFDGEGIPEVGDNIVQLGFQGGGNPIRTSAIILSATASDAPSTKYYQGITSFSLQDCEVKDEGFEGGQFHSRIYGTYYVGDREQTNYISYDPLTKTATFKGRAIFESGTTLPDGTPIEQLQGLGVKSGNLLLNSGFTGDFTSQEFDEKTEITDETTIFSDSAKYWECQNAEFIETTESASGHAATLTDGGLAQQLTASLVAGEKYTLSLKARGSSLRFTVGGYSETIQLIDELKRYSVIFECSDAEDTHFRIFEATAIVMEVTLNQGNLPIQWAAAYDDNDHAMADFEAFRYLTSAITEAKTTVNGGLVMTQDIRVGQFRDGKMTKETGGMSGYAATGNSPFIWGGGDMRQAFYTIGKYINDPGHEPTDAELKGMCAFVLTHGGRAILNEVIARGAIYATSGFFKNGIFQNVTAYDMSVQGSFCSPYVTAGEHDDITVSDNVFIDSKEWLNFYDLKWDLSQVGRTVRIANYFSTGVMLHAPSSDFNFFTSGLMVSSISIPSQGCMVLHGFGNEKKFYGWVVENSYAYDDAAYGYSFRTLSRGMVCQRDDGVDIYQHTFNGNLGVSRLGTGLYRLFLPIEWNDYLNTLPSPMMCYMGIMLTGCGYSKDDTQKISPIKATVKDMDWIYKDSKMIQVYIDVWTSDDSTVNDGDFQFLIYKR